MTSNFGVPAGVSALAARVTEFVRDVVVPVEEELGGCVHDGPEDLLRELRHAARSAGVFCPQASPELGGVGLDMNGQALVYERAGYSLLGPLALNCAAPDEGNMHLLGLLANDAQRGRYLGPLARGDVRSCFAMTEPAPGAGSDPRALRTTATRVRGGWRIDGRKWFISGARGAAFAICMARTSGEPGDATGATMFLVDLDRPGLTIERDLDTLDRGLFGGHSELRFDNCVVEDDQCLGEVDRGFEHAQLRLAPARLTHCMRWLGIACRAQDIALGYAARRELFGSTLTGLGMAQQLIADSEIDITASRALVADVASRMDEDVERAEATHLSSIAKVFVSEAVWRVVDRSIQLCGASGVSDELLLARYLREVRPFRIYDGPSETHRWAIARRVVRAHEQNA